MLVLLDGWLVPFVFLASIGSMILLNLGTNFILGEISYITKALSAVLQLAVTNGLLNIPMAQLPMSKEKNLTITKMLWLPP